MARTEAQKPATDKVAQGVSDALPPIVPMRKRPWLLAVLAACFTGWLLFLVAMALQP
jgi:hypothetical protein